MPTGTEPPEMVHGVVCVHEVSVPVRSRYVFHVLATFWFEVVHVPLEQLCEMSQIASYDDAPFVKAHV